MPRSFADFPPELYSAILDTLEFDNLQWAAYNLIVALPRSPVPRYHLYHYVRLRRPGKVLQLYLRLRLAPELAALIRGFSFESWSEDANILINTIALLPSLLHMRLFIGTNFEPEQLQQIFSKPIPRLKFLALRFRPYVERATYYHFHKGAYFDSTLGAIAQWPAAEMITLSIVQDQHDPHLMPTPFAQPIVFFRLDEVTNLTIAPLLAHAVNFRLRIPARQASRFIYTHTRALPLLERLDLSTCNVIDTDVESILERFSQIKHLVLDGCPIVSRRADAQEDWANLGKMIAMAGIKAAKNREKKFKQWTQENNINLDAVVIGEHARRPRKGRRGLATATISLRKSPPRQIQVQQQQQPGAPSGSAAPTERIRVLPYAPTLASLAATAPSSGDVEQHNAIRADFERGWSDGIRVLTQTRLRLLTSWRKGVRIMRMALEGEEDREDHDPKGDGERGWEGLIDVDDEDMFHLELAGGAVGALRCPRLCLAGPGKSDVHLPECGHQTGWDVWWDEL